MSTPNISSLLHETRSFPPSAEFVNNANLNPENYAALLAEAAKDPEAFWARLARETLLWRTPFTRVLDRSNAPFFRWFDDGVLNASFNCLDRHLPTQPDKVAIRFEDDNGIVTTVSYRELHRRVCQFANSLRTSGVSVGDRVLIYMPMSIHAVVAMQACARIGATHSVVFGGFSAKSIHERIVDAGATCTVTADGQLRGGKEIPLKPAVDEALAMGNCEAVHSVIVYQRTGTPVAMEPGRDRWWHDVVQNELETCEPAWVTAEHPLFILYTSGSTGKPKGVQHSTAGYLLMAMLTMKWVFDHRDGDVFWCTADVGWVTGHSYVAYGPLAVGATQVIFEGVPTHPDAGRFWRMIQDHQVTTFYTAPTAIRALIKAGANRPLDYDLSRLRLLGTVGEPINPEAWIWYFQTVGGGRCPIVDTWWQTETGAHMISPLPGVHALKPGSCQRPLPGIAAAIVDESGEDVPAGTGGFLVIKAPWPSMLRTLWGDPQRFVSTYFPEQFGGRFYLAGDGASLDDDGNFGIVGRIDDVLNVSGHRLGSMEIESALVANPLVAEAAVVGRADAITGQAVVAFVVLKESRPNAERAAEVSRMLQAWVTKEIGTIARPADLRFGDNLPKTRSGKIMRRLLRSLANGEAITQDVSTLENPAILEQLRGA